MGAIALAFVIRIAIFEAFEIEGPSMEPTLLEGDRVVVAKCRYGLFLPYASEALVRWSSPQVGDVVIVKSPEKATGEVDIVKRVVGLPGDIIEIRGHVIYRNEQPFDTEELGLCSAAMQKDPSGDCRWHQESTNGRTWRISRNDSEPPINHGPIQVPEDHVYVMGDHRDRSNDSRRLGPISMERIKGKALAIYWSSAHGWFWDQDYVFRPDRIFRGIE